MTKKQLQHAVDILKGKIKPKKMPYEKMIILLCNLTSNPLKTYRNSLKKLKIQRAKTLPN